MRFGVSALGWIVFTPFLLVLHERATLTRHLLVLGALAIGWLAAVSKMATEEISWVPVPLFAIPIACSYFVAIACGAFVHRRLGARLGASVFAAMAVVMGWIQYAFTPGASWGILAHTQIDNLPLVQLASVTGVGGITFLVALGSGLAAAAWRGSARALRTDLVVFALVVGAVHLYGLLRLGTDAPGPAIRVGSVLSPVTHKEFRGAVQDIDTLRPFDAELFARTNRAADLGARVVVWNEVATFVSPAGEAALAQQGEAFARERRVMLMMAYGVADSMHPFHYINKYRVYLPDGTMADEYIKRHPVPGDPNDPGQAHARVIAFDGVKFTGAICYDYSFPEISRDNARDGADVALVPASDWRGIDPQHGRMAIMNAVATGLPMVRPVRAARSVATDQYGRTLASLGARDGDGVFVVSLPGSRIPTVYAATGEIFPLIALGFSVPLIGLAFARRRDQDQT